MGYIQLRQNPYKIQVKRGMFMKYFLDFLIKMVLFIPITLGVFSFFHLLETDYPLTVLSSISIIIGIGFYYAINAMINLNMVNQYVGCRIFIQEEEFECSCGAKANMFIAETDAEETRVIIQCSDTSCCVSIQAYSITSAKLGWEAIS